MTEYKDETLDLALTYLDLHLGTRYIFPVRKHAKYPPLVSDNLAMASNDPEQIRKWHATWPGCSWGLSHKKSHTMVIDVDCNAAKGKTGQLTFDLLDLEFGFPSTETSTTPSNGRHHIYTGPHVFALGIHGLGACVDSPNYSILPGCKTKDGEYVSNGAPAVACPQWIYDTIGRAKVRIADADEVVVDLDQQPMIEWAIDYLKHDAEPSIEGQGGEHVMFKT